MLYLLMCLVLNCNSQNINKIAGKYIYNIDNFNESIYLKNNGTFIYNVSMPFYKSEIRGNWQIRGEKIILDSYPQKEKLIVSEKRKGTLKKTTFKVVNKKGEPISYKLLLVTNSQDTICFLEQWKKTETYSKIKGFFIQDSKGLKSPYYKIKGTSSNYFEVIFETIRIFENEDWLFTNGKIKPKGLDSKYQKYFLIKRNN